MHAVVLKADIGGRILVGRVTREVTFSPRYFTLMPLLCAGAIPSV